MHTLPPAAALFRRRYVGLILALIVVILAVRNLPWHLDNYDQAKQAFVSFEIVETGSWWFQHTPSGRIATKPPLAGWISTGLYFLSGQTAWELAWRLPPFICALVLLGMIWRSGRLLGGETAALIAVCACALNLIAPRLATLVRTDMMLTLFIFIAGWLVLEKVRTGLEWTTRERWGLFAAVLASMLTKGPILYAFLLPGLAAYAWISYRDRREKVAWAGWWPWFLPLVIFGVWAGIGVWLSQDFYRQVVLREFLGRFDMGESPVHQHQPGWFYFVHLLHKWLPWSVALIGLFCVRTIRQTIRREPELLWLAFWAAGGLIFMSVVPSKRVDRIFPVIPPLCLLLGALATRWLVVRSSIAQRKWMAGSIAAAFLISGGYAVSQVYREMRDDQRGLVRFGHEVRALTAAHPERLALLDGDDEGLLLYTRCLKFTKMDAALEAWRKGEIDWLIIPNDDDQKVRPKLGDYEVVLEQPRLRGRQSAYTLVRRETTP